MSSIAVQTFPPNINPKLANRIKIHYIAADILSFITLFCFYYSPLNVSVCIMFRSTYINISMPDIHSAAFSVAFSPNATKRGYSDMCLAAMSSRQGHCGCMQPRTSNRTSSTVLCTIQYDVVAPVRTWNVESTALVPRYVDSCYVIERCWAGTRSRRLILSLYSLSWRLNIDQTDAVSSAAIFICISLVCVSLLCILSCFTDVIRRTNICRSLPHIPHRTAYIYIYIYIP